MKKIFNLLLVISIFSGCQSALSVFNKTNTQYERGLQHTKVKPIVKDGETLAILNVTYLNSMNKKKWDKQHQNFLVGIYISEDAKEKNNQSLNNPKYKITMNDKTYVKAILFTKDYALYKNIPLKNPWAKYYILSFEKDNKATLNIKYSNENNTSINLSFSKE